MANILTFRSRRVGPANTPEQRRTNYQLAKELAGAYRSFRCSPGSIFAEHDAELLSIYAAAGAGDAI